MELVAQHAELGITRVIYDPGNGEMNLAVAIELQLHAETCGLQIMLIALLGKFGHLLIAMTVRWQVNDSQSNNNDTSQ